MINHISYENLSHVACDHKKTSEMLKASDVFFVTVYCPRFLKEKLLPQFLLEGLSQRWDDLVHVADHAVARESASHLTDSFISLNGIKLG